MAQIETSENTHSVRIVLEGDLDTARAEALRPRMKALVAEGCLYFILDLARVRFICSMGLGLLVEVHNAVTPSGGSLRIENPQPSVERLLMETRLLPIFRAAESPEQDRIEALQVVQEQMGHEILFLSHLNDVSSNILRAEVTDEAYPLVLQGILRSLDSPRGALFVLRETEQGPALRAVASHGIESERVRLIGQTPLAPRSFEADCLRKGEARFFGSTESGAALSPLLEAAGIAAGVLAPIVGRRAPLGLVLVAAPVHGSPFFPQSAPLVEVFANVCGLAIEKQMHLEDIRRKNQQLAHALSDLSRTQASLMEAGRLAVIGALMRGLAHVLNNKLVPILGYTQILAMKAEPGSDEATKIAIIERSTLEIRQIVENLKTRVSHEHLVIEEHDPHEIVDSALYILDYLFREHHILVEQVRGADPAPRVELDRGRFMQAILALLQRLPAAFAGQHDRRLLIQTEFADREWLLRLRDNGKRFSPEQLRSILSPVDAGDDLFNDDRLNFSIATAVLKDHRGTLRVIPNDDLGIAVEMRIPVLHARPQRIG